MHDNVSIATSSSIVRDLVDECKTSNRYRVETSFGPNFLTTHFIEDFDVNFLTYKLFFAFFIKEHP